MTGRRAGRRRVDLLGPLASAYGHGVLSPTLATWRLAIHVFAATIWVGGQFVLGALLPTIRRAAPNATPVVARAFARIAWPAFAVLVITGIWNLSEIAFSSRPTSYQVTLLVKIALAALSGTAAAVHQIGRDRLALAVGGALAAIGAVGALFLGVLLMTGTS
jgi:putative copper export protein